MLVLFKAIWQNVWSIAWLLVSISTYGTLKDNIDFQFVSTSNPSRHQKRVCKLQTGQGKIWIMRFTKFSSFLASPFLPCQDESCAYANNETTKPHNNSCVLSRFRNCYTVLLGTDVAFPGVLPNNFCISPPPLRPIGQRRAEFISHLGIGIQCLFWFNKFDFRFNIISLFRTPTSLKFIFRLIAQNHRDIPENSRPRDHTIATSAFHTSANWSNIAQFAHATKSLREDLSTIRTSICEITRKLHMKLGYLNA